MSKITYCALCSASFSECRHHLLFGRSQRKLAEADYLTLDICNNCHNMANKPEDRIHGNPRAEDLSKMLGQAIWELKAMEGAYAEATGDNLGNDIREAFRRRYGRSYL